MTTAIGWLGTALVVASYTQTEVSRLRRLSLAASVVLITFNVVIGVWSNVALEAALVAINVARLQRPAEPPTLLDDGTRAGGQIAAR